MVHDAVRRHRRRGGARVSIANFTDQSIANNGGGALPGLAYGDDMAKWNFAWALHAGVAYQINQSFTVELAYRYLNTGNGMAGDLKLRRHQQRLQSDDVQEHHLARSDARRALGSRQPGAGLCAAADTQGLIAA